MPNNDFLPIAFTLPILSNCEIVQVTDQKDLNNVILELCITGPNRSGGKPIGLYLSQRLYLKQDAFARSIIEVVNKPEVFWKQLQLRNGQIIPVKIIKAGRDWHPYWESSVFLEFDAPPIKIYDILYGIKYKVLTNLKDILGKNPVDVLLNDVGQPVWTRKIDYTKKPIEVEYKTLP